jgi:hypothetical protein
MGAVGHGECVHHEAVGQGGKLTGKIWGVLFLAGVEPEILQQKDISGRHGPDRGCHRWAEAVGQAPDRAFQ